MNLEYPERWNADGKATKDWYYGFMGRHRNLSLRKPDNVSAARAKGFCREHVNEFFANYKAALDEKPYSASQIWNIDESGFPTVPTKTPLVVAERGNFLTE